jgi:hypothetical protein
MLPLISTSKALLLRSIQNPGQTNNKTTKRSDKLIKNILIFMLLLAIMSGSVMAANWYVDSSASGGNGQSWGSAWKSFSSIQWGSISPGDTVYISGGSNGKTYSQELSVKTSGTSSAPVTITGGKDSGHNGLVTFTSNGIYVEARRYVTISKMKFTGGARIKISGADGAVYDPAGAASHIIVDDCEFYIQAHGAVFIQASDNIIVRNSRMSTPTNDGAQTDGIYSQRNLNNIYENNHILMKNQGGGHNDCIQMYRDTSTIVRNNYCAQINDKSGNAQGIYATTSHGVLKYYNNVVNLGNAQSNAMTFQKLPNYQGAGGTGTVHMIGNTIYAIRPYHGIWVQDASNMVVKNNIVHTLNKVKISTSSSSGDVSNNYIAGDPKFVSIANNDFHLTSGSPAIDGGVNLGSPYDTDKDGNSRGSNWDIGAFEYGGSPPNCVDSDGDGYGQGCSLGPDCNDNADWIHPGAAEICGNNIDEDCSGSDLACGGSGADANGDGCVDLGEIAAYVGRWKNGQVTLQEVVAGVEKWQQGCV